VFQHRREPLIAQAMLLAPGTYSFEVFIWQFLGETSIDYG
jgi:hypothetical protein